MKHLQFIFTLCILTLKVSTYAQHPAGCESYGYPLWNEPDELYRGRLKKEGALYGNPYTMMDRTRFPIANDGFIEIRRLISKKTDITNLYENIVNIADNVRPAAGGGETDDISGLAIWTKYNAFVFIIGLDPANDYQQMDIVDPTGNLRNGFRDRALLGFQYMNFSVPSILNDGNNLLQHRCRELMMYCQAYDWLKAAPFDPSISSDRWPLEPYDLDRNSGTCSPRYRLRLFARNFYQTAKGWLGPIEHTKGWKKNHGIIAASAMLTCAIVLNDAGVRDIRPRWSPIRWFEKANEGLYSKIPTCWYSGINSHV